MIDKTVLGIAVPKELGELGVELAHELAIQLGESPEAWRGARDFAVIVRAGITAELAHSIECTGQEEGEVALPELHMIFLIGIEVLARMPMWPKDDDDES
jgi:hypothetical protein